MAQGQTVSQITQPHMTFVTNSGAPCINCQLWTYQAGTTTPQATYTDSTAATQNSNPVILGTDGGAPIWVGQNPYKFILKDSKGNTIWTADNVTAFLPLSGGQITGSLSVNGPIYMEEQNSAPSNPSSNYAVTWVDTAGNWNCKLPSGASCGLNVSALAVSGNLTAGSINSVLFPAPGTSLATAYNSLPSTGGTIILALGTYTSGLDTGTFISKPNVKIYGSGMPQPNCTLPCTPTALTGGTIIQGEVDVAGYSSLGSAIGFEMHDLGIDVGSTVVTNIYSGTPHNGLAMANIGQIVGGPQTTGVSVSNVVVLGDLNNSPVHAFLFEHLTGANFAHLYSYLDGIGQVFKTSGSHINDIHCSGHGTACMYIKSDTYAPAGGNTVDGVIAQYLATPGDTSGLNLDAGSATLDGNQLTNLVFSDTTSGVNFLMDSATGLFVNNNNISNFKMDDGDIASGSRTAPCFFFFTTGSSTAERNNINNAVCNNVEWAVWMTSNDSWQSNTFSNISGANFTGPGMILSGFNTSVVNSYLTGIASGQYGYLPEGTSASTVNLYNVQAYNGLGIWSPVGSPTVNYFTPQGTSGYAALGVANTFTAQQNVEVGSGGSFRVLPPDDSSSTKQVFGTNHAQNAFVWWINDDGSANFPNIPTVGSPTVGQAACIKSAGPPIVIGYCSTTPTSGTCTCN